MSNSMSMSELLNPDPDPADNQPSSSPPHDRSTATKAEDGDPHPGQLPDNDAVICSTQDAADSLAQLAGSSSAHLGRDLIPNNELSEPPPAAYHVHARKYSESHTGDPYGQVAAPIEPSPPAKRSDQPFASSLAQYHHGPQSPERARRQSAASRTSPPPKLAPIQSSPVTEDNQMDGAERTTHSEGEQASTDKSEREPTRGEDGMEDIQRTAEEREPSYTRDTPKTSQIRQPSPALPLIEEPEAPSPSVKLEPSATPRDSSPDTVVPVSVAGDRSSVRASSTEVPTPKAETQLNDESGTKKRASSKAKSATPAAKPSTKKRPAPKSAAAAKKGTASSVKKPAPKKRKLDDESLSNTPVSKRSATPAGSRSSKTPANRKASAAFSDDEDEFEMPDRDGEDESEVFCICRKPDNHTWMIGCDGGCEDWFHGKCVDIREQDGNLIDKYICPNCSESGKGNTTWKPMCRLPRCRQPARLSKSGPSKYCCDDHGREFMRLHALGSKSPERQKSPVKHKKKRVENQEDEGQRSDDDSDNDFEPSKGGALHPSELSTISKSIPSFSEFRQLGNTPLSPSQQKRLHTDNTDTPEGSSSPTKTASLLKTRTALLQLLRARSQTALASHYDKKASKDICGYDSRLAWSDAEVARWRDSKEGRKALETGSIGPPTSPPSSAAANDEDGAHGDGAVDGTGGQDRGANDGGEEEEQDPNGNEDEDGDAQAMMLKGLCLKRRCERHRNWFKVASSEIRFEEAVLEEDRKRMRLDGNTGGGGAMTEDGTDGKADGQRQQQDQHQHQHQLEEKEGWAEVVD
ncbi:MAG: hypothetical protein M1819_006116 [Sarea resinae]|nr:MAG: hypothetical protein M1819_006116 [Sarea resinae]